MNFILVRRFRSTVSALVSTLLLTLTWASIVFGGEIHDAAQKGNFEKVKALLADNPALVTSKDAGDSPLHVAALQGAPLFDLSLEMNRLEFTTVDDKPWVSNADGVVKEFAFGRRSIELETNRLRVADGKLFVLTKNFGEVTLKTSYQGQSEPTPTGAQWDKLRAFYEAGPTSYTDKVVRLLLEKGADANVENNSGATPLHFATFVGNAPVAAALLEAGAEVDAKESHGWTPLWRAALQGRETVAELLLTSGADPSSKNNDGNSPLHAAAHTGCTKVVKLLLAHGVNVDIKSAKGETPLHAAAGRGHPDVVQLLLSSGAEADAKDKDGATPLFHMAMKRNWAVHSDARNAASTLLIKNEANVNVRAGPGYTPLFMAAFVGNMDLLKILLANGADPNAADSGGKMTPLKLAVSRGHDAVADLLRQHGAKE